MRRRYIRFMVIVISTFMIFPLFVDNVQSTRDDITYEYDINYIYVNNSHYDFWVRRSDLGIRAIDSNNRPASAFYTFLGVFETDINSNTTNGCSYVFQFLNTIDYFYLNFTGYLYNAVYGDNLNQAFLISYRFDDSPIIDVKIWLDLKGNHKLAYINNYFGCVAYQTHIYTKINRQYISYNGSDSVKLAPTMGKNDWFIRYYSLYTIDAPLGDIVYGIKMLYFGRPVCIAHANTFSYISLLNYKYTQDYSIYTTLGNDAKYNITDELFYTHYQYFLPAKSDRVYDRLELMTGRIVRISKFGTPAPYMASLCIEVDVDGFSPEKVEYLTNYFDLINIKPTISVWFGIPPNNDGECDDWIFDNSKYLRENSTFQNAIFSGLVNHTLGFAIHSITSGNDTRISYIENVTWLYENVSEFSYQTYIQHGASKNIENPRYVLSNNSTYYIADLIVNNNITYNSLGASIYSDATGLNVEFSGNSYGTATIIWNGMREWIRTNLGTYNNFIDRITTTNLDYLVDMNGLAILYTHMFENSYYNGAIFTTDAINALNLIKTYSETNDNPIFVETTENVMGYYSAIAKTDWEIYYNNSGFVKAFAITGEPRAMSLTGTLKEVTYCQYLPHEELLLDEYGFNIRVSAVVYGAYEVHLMTDYGIYDYYLYLQTGQLARYSYITVSGFGEYLVNYVDIYFVIPDFLDFDLFYSLLYLTIIFIPAIILNYFIPRFALIIGVGGSTAVLAFTGFVPIPYFTLIMVGVIIYMYRGEEW